jgi:hypothetical protein
VKAITGDSRPIPKETKYDLPRCVLIKALITAAALAVETASYAQGDSRLWDPSRLPQTKGIVKQYALTPHGDVDGLILTDGTEVKLPPHLTRQLVFAVKPGCSFGPGPESTRSPAG